MAEFLGDSNIFTGVLDAAGASIRLDGDDVDIHAADCRGAQPGRPAALMVRPSEWAPRGCSPPAPSRTRRATGSAAS